MTDFLLHKNNKHQIVGLNLMRLFMYWSETSLLFLKTFVAAQERQSRRADQRPVHREYSAAESSGDNGATAQNSREEELPAGREDLQPEQDRSRPKPVDSPRAVLQLPVPMMYLWKYLGVHKNVVHPNIF